MGTALHAHSGTQPAPGCIILDINTSGILQGVALGNSPMLVIGIVNDIGNVLEGLIVWQEPGGGLEITVGRVDGVKCARCWRYVRSVSTDAEVEGLCERCISSLSETVSAS